MLSIQAVRGLPRLRAPGIVPCIISFSRQLPCFLMVLPQFASFLALTVSNGSLFTPALLRIHSFVFFAVHETRNILLSPFISKAYTSCVYISSALHCLCLKSLFTACCTRHIILPTHSWCDTAATPVSTVIARRRLPRESVASRTQSKLRQRKRMIQTTFLVDEHLSRLADVTRPVRSQRLPQHLVVLAFIPAAHATTADPIDRKTLSL